MIEENATDQNVGTTGPSAAGQEQASMINTPPPPTPGDPRQKPGEVPQEPNEAPAPPPREIPPAPEPNEGDRERATH
jgi:hypothetical protein